MRIVKEGVELSILSDCDGEDYYEINVSDTIEVDIDEIYLEYYDIMSCKDLKFPERLISFSQYLQEQIK